jgi:hypothetical protein
MSGEASQMPTGPRKTVGDFAIVAALLCWENSSWNFFAQQTEGEESIGN